MTTALVLHGRVEVVLGPMRCGVSARASMYDPVISGAGRVVQLPGALLVPYARLTTRSSRVSRETAQMARRTGAVAMTYGWLNSRSSRVIGAPSAVFS